MQQGDFVWYELCTPAPEAAANFYGEVLGWTVKPSPLPDIDYILACIGDHPIAGIMTLPPAQMPPHPIGQSA
jgi:predicted enzyme related to lactoylglutathione lyase